jgi:hypothetical protein
MNRRDIVVGVIAGVTATALAFEARAQRPGRTYVPPELLATADEVIE